MCGHIVRLMHCIHFISDPQGSIFLLNMNIPFNFLSLVVFDDSKETMCSKKFTAQEGGLHIDVNMRRNMKYKCNKSTDVCS